MKLSVLTFAFLAVLNFSKIRAQNAVKVVFADTKNYYLKLVPKNKPVGILIILHGGGENAESVMKQIKLDDIALQKNFIVVFPNIVDSDFQMKTEQRFIDIIAKGIVEKYKVSKEKIFMGGLSGGGMLTITYTERAVRDKDTYFVPKAIFALDPPLDYENMYYRYQREIERNFSEIGVREAKWFIDELETNLGGTPETAKQAYVKNSMFSYHEKDGGNAKYLINMPIKIYTEPGVEWQIKNRRRDLYDLNCTDISAMINFLQLKGNKNAEIVTTKDKGVRPDGTKHPHSWTIMDTNDSMNWILSNMK